MVGQWVPGMEFKQFLKSLQGVVGEENVVYHSDDLLVFEYDGSVDRGMPEAVVFPSTTAPACRVLMHGRRSVSPSATALHSTLASSPESLITWG